MALAPQPFMKELVWEPVLVAEFSVPWNNIMLLTGHSSNFFGPIPVCADKKLFIVCCNSKYDCIRLHLEPCNDRTRELLVTSRVLWTKRVGNEAPFNQDPLKWPLPEEYKSTHLIPIPSQKKINFEDNLNILNESLPKIRCFTVRLQVHARRATPSDSLSTSLNSARMSGSSFCDVQLRVSGHDFPAHKAVLSVTSSVFMTMFTGGFKEKTADSVIIEGVSKEAFGKFLDFLYTEDIAGWKGHELELLDLSERYQVERLKARCEMVLWGLDGPRALGILMEADKWPVLTDGMKNRLYQRVAASLRSVVDSDDWKTLHSSNPVLSGIIQACPAIGAPSFEVFTAKHSKPHT